MPPYHIENGRIVCNDQTIKNGLLEPAQISSDRYISTDATENFEIRASTILPWQKETNTLLYDMLVVQNWSDHSTKGKYGEAHC